MSRPLDDRELQDYLDGRLSDERRAEVEARLRADRAAARRVEAWREIGNALREDDAEPSPGFYGRARAQFEASSARLPRGFRILSWEAAGLAAAVALALALFAPDLVRMRGRQDAASPTRPSRLVRAPAESEAHREKKGEAEMQREERAAEGFAAAPEIADLTPDADDAEVAEALELAPDPDTAAPFEPVERQDAPRPRAEGQARESIGKARRAGVAPAPLAAPDAPQVFVLDAAPPPGSPPLDGLRVVEDPAEWQAWTGATPGRGRLADDDPALRRLLVGARGGLRCDALAVAVEAGRYVVRVPGGDAPACAFVLPADGREVVLARVD